MKIVFASFYYVSAYIMKNETNFDLMLPSKLVQGAFLKVCQLV